MCSCKHCRLSAQSLWARSRAASSFGPHRRITCTPSRVAAISSALLRPPRGSPCACSSPRPRRPSPGDDARGRHLGNSPLYNLSSYLSRTSDLRSKIGATSSIIKLRPRTSPAGSASDTSLASFTPSARMGRPARATTRPPPGGHHERRALARRVTCCASSRTVTVHAMWRGVRGATFVGATSSGVTGEGIVRPAIDGKRPDAGQSQRCTGRATAPDAQVAHTSPTLAEEGCIPPPSSVHTSRSTASCSAAAVGDTHITLTHGTVGWHCRIASPAMWPPRCARHWCHRRQCR